MSSFEKFCAIFIACCLLILALCADGAICWHLGYDKGYKAAGENARVDTVTVVDTHYVDKPVPQYVYVDKPIYVPVHDTTLVFRNDTTFVVLPREVKGYADSTYRCEVSGVEPSLDWIEVYQKTQIITKTIPDTRRWTFGLTAGPSVVWNPNGLHAGVGLTGGLQYRF